MLRLRIDFDCYNKITLFWETGRYRLLLKSFKNETLLSQGLLENSHVSQSLSKFTCCNIKTSSFDASLWYLWWWINMY